MRTIWIAALAVSALPGDAVVLRSRVAVGDELNWNFHHESEFSLEELAVLMNGEEDPNAPPMDGVKDERQTVLHLELRDRILRAEDGSASSLERAYVELELSRSMQMVDPMGGEHGDDMVLESKLAGRKVNFERDGEQIVRRWAKDCGEESKKDDALLDGLALSLGIEQLLPKREVEVGDTWSVSAALLETLRRPAGDLHFEAREGANTDTPQDIGQKIEPEIDGTITARLARIREDGGERLAEIEIAIEVSESLDLTKVAPKMQRPEDAPPEMVEPELQSMEHRSEHVGHGVFLWDLKAGRLRSLEIQCDVERTETVRLSVSNDGDEMEIEQKAVLTGSESFEVRCNG